jgi:hypothetical protein
MFGDQMLQFAPGNPFEVIGNAASNVFGISRHHQCGTPSSSVSSASPRNLPVIFDPVLDAANDNLADLDQRDLHRSRAASRVISQPWCRVRKASISCAASPRGTVSLRAWPPGSIRSVMRVARILANGQRKLTAIDSDAVRPLCGDL